MGITEFLKKNLQGYTEKDHYCSGKYTGSVTTLVESYMAITNSLFRKASSHRKGTSKRFKPDLLKSKSLWFSSMNSLVPIPFNGYLFEIIGTETWHCCVASDEKIIKSTKTNLKRRLSSATKCPAAIQVRTVKMYTEYVIQNDGRSSENRKKQEKIKALVLEKLNKGEAPAYKVVSFCRFPMDASHLYHKPSLIDVSRNRMDKRVANKIKLLAKSGIYNLDNLQLMLSDYVKTTLFGHLEEDEWPHPNNTRYFPTKRVIYNHVVAAVGPMKTLHINALKAIQPSPLVVSIEQDCFEAEETKNSVSGIGLVAVHAGAGYHSDERWPGYHSACDEACWLATACLKSGGTAGEAVAIAVKALEDSELTNAGFGSNLTEDGNIECDAAVMDASSSLDGRATFGAVTGVSRVKNPVLAAYQVARQQVIEPKRSFGRIPPCVMSGIGAENWAKAHDVAMCDKKGLISEKSYKEWQKYSRMLFESLTQNHEKEDGETDAANSQRFDTVGAVAMDVRGGVASAASSGGLLMKLPGRIGQAAMYGCGCWAESGNNSKPSVAVATSGCGEQLMYAMVAKKCAENLQSDDEPYAAMRDTLLRDFLNSPHISSDVMKHAGLLALHQSNDEANSITELIWGHTTSSMVVAHMSTKDFKPEVILSRLPEGATAGKSLSVSGTWVKVAMETTDADQSHSSIDSQNSIVDQSAPPLLTSTPQLDGTYDSFTLDDDISLMYISTDVDGTPMGQCVANLSPDHNRKIDKYFELSIDTRWQERCEKNPRLFNASKFRIDSIEENGETLQINLGLTCYKDYMETNWSRDVDRLRDMGSRDFDNPQAYLSDPLGVAGIVATSDGHVVFQRRNHWVAEGAGKLDVPGGHPEPSVAAHQTDQSEIDLSHLQPDDVISEIFTSQLKEVRDELNLPLECLSEPKLMGLVRNSQSAGRPVCYFYIRCSLSSNEIEERYERGGAETDESTELVFKVEKDLVRLERDLPEFWSELCPNGKAAVSLFSILKQVKMGNSPFQLK